MSTDTIISTRPDYDAIVVGASLAGCAAATLLARRGARVALVERRPDPAAFKRVCGHYIQSSAVPALEELGLLEPIVEAGGVRSHGRLHTRWGWIESPEGTEVPAAVNIRRERLDPMIRSLAAATPGVDLLLGHSVSELVWDRGRVTGIRVTGRDRRSVRLDARLVVGADGRDSAVARLARVPERRHVNRRFAYGAYFEGPPPAASPNGSIWLRDPDWAAAFPTDSGLVMYTVMPHLRRLDEFRADPLGAMVATMAALPDAPPVEAARVVSPVIGRLDMTNISRRVAGDGLALVGDAALCSDPVWGVGCGWALQSASWLAEAVAPVLADGRELGGALARYRRHHRRALGGHAKLIDDYATGRRFTRGERYLFSAAAHDDVLAERFGAFGSRILSPRQFLTPATMARAGMVHAGRALGRAESGGAGEYAMLGG